MALIVQKYGGTSVADLAKIKRVAKKIGKYSKDGNQVVVVVSAMAGETDRLLHMADSLSGEPPQRELDLLLSSGERISSALLAISLRSSGVDALSFTGRQVGILTDSAHFKARIKKIDAKRITETLESGAVPVIAGFQGINENGDVTTMGRGGSDLSAVAIASALQAEECLVFKDDVDGVYTSDPSVVPSARKLPWVSYEEMLEMSGTGAKVLHSRAVEVAAKYDVRLRVLSTFGRGEGTLITREEKGMEKEVITGVVADKNQAKITICSVPDRPGIASDIFGRIAEKNVLVDMIIQNVSENNKTDISLTVPTVEAKTAFNVVKEIAKDIKAGSVEMDAGISKISIIGVGMKSHSGVAAKMFKVLAEKGINIMMISTSEIRISCVIKAEALKEAARLLHDAFHLERKRVKL
ncbi:MAG: aspartate kinase [Nitrospinota bacterium]